MLERLAVNLRKLRPRVGLEIQMGFASANRRPSFRVLPVRKEVGMMLPGVSGYVVVCIHDLQRGGF